MIAEKLDRTPEVFCVDLLQLSITGRHVEDADASTAYQSGKLTLP